VTISILSVIKLSERFRPASKYGHLAVHASRSRVCIIRTEMCQSLSQPGTLEVACWNLALKLEFNALKHAPAGYD